MIETSQSGDVARLALTGEFDLASTQQFHDALARVADDGAKTLVVDLTALEFMDSSGLRSLVMANDRLKAAGQRMVIVPGPPHIRRVFEITQLESRLELVDDPSQLGS